ncbi:MAG: hypothetical protein WC581_07880, partial [Thermodesulfovibrionales bacterium]
NDLLLGFDVVINSNRGSLPTSTTYRGIFREWIFLCQGSPFETFSYNSPNKREAHLRDMAADCFYRL